MGVRQAIAFKDREAYWIDEAGPRRGRLRQLCRRGRVDPADVRFRVSARWDWDNAGRAIGLTGVLRVLPYGSIWMESTTASNSATSESDDAFRLVVVMATVWPWTSTM
jgi:hypothetical protein